MNRYYKPKKLYVRRQLRRSAQFRQWVIGMWKKPIQYSAGDPRGFIRFITDTKGA